MSGAAAAAPLLRGLATGLHVKTSPLCQKLRSDQTRPRFHLLPASNWMNDPNGPIFFNGKYHLFYQYNPDGAIWGNMHWAHASSPDMVYWKHEPIAIAPTPGGPDQDGVFSGSAILDHGTPTVIYTGVRHPASDAETTLRDGVHTWRETQCLATSQDADLDTWQKVAQPVIASPPPGMAVTGFRDPLVWREGDSWMLTLGSGVRNKGGMVLLYTSPDLRNWTYLHPLVEGSRSGQSSSSTFDTGDMWECPDFFPLGNKHVLLVSTKGKVLWKVGTYKDQRFSPEKEGLVDWGAYYAAKTTVDQNGNRILWGWITETRPQAEYSAAGWAGVMALPRVLSLSADDELQFAVLPAVQKLRTPAEMDPRMRNKQTLDALRIRDLSAELQIEYKKPASSFALHLQSEIGEKFATIGCASTSGVRELQVNNLKAPISGDPAQPVRIHLFLDGSVLEVFANRATVLTARIYRTPSSPLLFGFEGDPELIDLQAWQIKPISKDRLTSPLCD
jgi:beta-fructofuranosidase